MPSRFNQIGVVYRDQNDTTLSALKRLQTFLSSREISYSESVIASRPDDNLLDIDDDSSI